MFKQRFVLIIQLHAQIQTTQPCLPYNEFQMICHSLHCPTLSTSKNAENSMADIVNVLEDASFSFNDSKEELSYLPIQNGAPWPLVALTHSCCHSSPQGQ
jgi:hypothetical protein